MVKFDFDEEIDRRNTNSVKWDFAARRGKPPDALPLWVADMDFRAPPCVLQALHRAVDHGIFGYSEVGEDYFDTVAAWFLKRYRWETQSQWLVKTPGVVFALATAVRALTQPGDSVLVQPPVYYPFYGVVRDNHRAIVEADLIYRDGQYSIDFADFERKAAAPSVKLFLLCSPHNPVGRVWTLEELRRLGEICSRHGVYVVSDEIHCDLTRAGHVHTVFLRACPELAGQAIVCTSPSKSFNLAGLQVSNNWIPDPGVRQRFRQAMAQSGCSQINLMGLVAAQAAYTDGEAWLEACKDYLWGNLDYLRTFLAERLPELRLVEPEGSYFAWLDCSSLGFSPEELDDLVSNRAKLWLDAGEIFGKRSGQFQRLVFACTRKTLERALTQLEQAVHDR